MTEHNIFQEIEEDLERQKYADLWKRHGSSVMTVAFAIVLGTAAVSWWNSWHAHKNQTATASFLNVMEQSDTDPGRQMGSLEAFALKGRGSAHAVIAQLAAAGIASKAGNAERAAQLYDHVAKDSQADPAFRQFADLMSVRAQMDTGDPAVLEKRLEPLLANNAPWRYTAMEHKGYLALRTGDKARAREIFSQLSQDPGAPQSLSVRAGDVLHFISQ